MDSFEKTAGYVLLGCLCVMVCLLTAIGVLFLTTDSADSPSYETAVSQPTFTPAPKPQTSLSAQKTPTLPQQSTILEFGTSSSTSSKKHSSSSSSSTSTTAVQQSPPPAQNQTPPAPLPADSTMKAKLQAIMDDHPEKSNLPSDTAILITFFDRSEQFILEGQTISDYEGQDYDLEFTTGDYYLDDFHENFCGTVNNIKRLQDFHWILNKNKFSLLYKYGSVLSAKHMCN